MKKEISFFFSGFHYMDYLSNEYAEKIIGRDKLFNNPFLTHKEALSDGILLQVGNTPYDCLTPEGEALLVKATEALY